MRIMAMDDDSFAGLAVMLHLAHDVVTDDRAWEIAYPLLTRKYVERGNVAPPSQAVRDDLHESIDVLRAKVAVSLMEGLDETPKLPAGLEKALAGLLGVSGDSQAGAGDNDDDDLIRPRDLYL